MKYEILDKQFNSINAIYTYVRDVIDKTSLNTVLNDKDKNFFIELIKKHPESTEKMGIGIKELQITHNYNKQKHVKIIRRDGSDDVISMKTCCTYVNTEHKINPLQNLNRAMRSSIEPDIEKFRRNIRKQCKVCLVTSFKNPFHIDHIYPFDNIMKEFLEEYDDSYLKLTFTRDPITFRTIFKEEDAPFRDEWIVYHNKVATLQLLCESCNCKKGKSYFSKGIL